eukprot:1859865-Rhodomonas_salina.1
MQFPATANTTLNHQGTWYSGSHGAFRGYLDDVRIYEGMLTMPDVQALVRKGESAPTISHNDHVNPDSLRVLANSSRDLSTIGRRLLVDPASCGCPGWQFP